MTSSERVAARFLEAHTLPVHLPAKADESIGDAYRSLVSFKQALDSMEEIPALTKPLYEEIGKAINAISEARVHTNQVREMVRRNRF